MSRVLRRVKKQIILHGRCFSPSSSFPGLLGLGQWVAMGVKMASSGGRIAAAASGRQHKKKTEVPEKTLLKEKHSRKLRSRNRLAAPSLVACWRGTRRLPCRLTFLLLGLGLITSCGYQLEGRGVFLPSHIRSVAIPVFENASLEKDLGIVLTNAVTEELNRRGGVKIISEKEGADAVLNGRIESYTFYVIATDQDGQATAYRVEIKAKLSFEDRIRKEVRWEDTLSKTVDYEVGDSAASTDIQEIEAVKEASRDFAKTVVSVVFLGF